MPFPNIKTSDLHNSAKITPYNTEFSSIPVLNIDPIRQGPTFITPEEEIMGFDPNFGYFTHTIPEVSYGYRDQGADNYQPSDVYSPDPQKPPITGRWAGSLMNTMANNGINHGHAANLFGLFNGSGMNFTDDTGTINIGLTGLSTNDKAGRSYSISTNGDLGYTQAFNNGKTSAGVTVNPLNKSIYGKFSFGGRNPVQEFTGIEGLPEDVNASIPDSIVLGTREVNTVPLSAGESYLNSMLPALMDKYTNAGKPNF